MYKRQCTLIDCFANDFGDCDLLSKTNWKGKPCPFYKHESEVDKVKIEAEIRAYEHGVISAKAKKA